MLEGKNSWHWAKHRTLRQDTRTSSAQYGYQWCDTSPGAGYFQCQDLGAQTLRGVTEAMRVYHVLSESGAASRLDVTHPRGLTPLVGHEQEVGLLLERWAQAKSGQGQVVLLTGEAGIGKSRLVQMLRAYPEGPHVCWECRVRSTLGTRYSFSAGFIPTPVTVPSYGDSSRKMREMNRCSASIDSPWNLFHSWRLCSRCLS